MRSGLACVAAEIRKIVTVFLADVIHDLFGLLLEYSFTRHRESDRGFHDYPDYGIT